MADLILFWHRRDLRLEDSTGLAAGRALTPRIVGLFCLDPILLRGPGVAAVRVQYLLGCLADLQQAYHRIGSHLILVEGDPRQMIPQVAATLRPQAVYWHQDVEPYARQRDAAVAQALADLGIPSQTFWDQLLHPPDAVTTQAGRPFTVYTPFWKAWNRLPKGDPLPTPQNCVGLTPEEMNRVKAVVRRDLPTLRDLGYESAVELGVEPGTSAALHLLETFCADPIRRYGEDRNFPAIPGTSQLSAALKFGVVGIRQVWAASQEAAGLYPGDLEQAAIQTWQQELAWREFYQHGLYHFPHLVDQAHRRIFDQFPWDNQAAHFEAWCTGQTGYPMVDAAMRQLNETGWMHNRCRMIVASFLTKDLLIDWRWGEHYFMERLVDGDLSANNGGWQWSASVGMDPKPLRIFNPATQAARFDPEGAYIRHWLPELRGVDTPELLSGQMLPIERAGRGYPPPIVDHKRQQALFKQRYQRLTQGAALT
ncbi:MAG: deoxyribodipyrimidine photo-lyase [Gloeomargaritaceae cyanobacterium C42_A2020_066]|nr:deoxyribodipyrimidine photo-lyase [Gloeomargaritaceae cyanobacterium C42_A2020_066]